MMMTALPCMLTLKHWFPIEFSPMVPCVRLVSRDSLKNSLKKLLLFTFGMLLRACVCVCVCESVRVHRHHSHAHVCSCPIERN